MASRKIQKTLAVASSSINPTDFKPLVIQALLSNDYPHEVSNKLQNLLVCSDDCFEFIGEKLRSSVYRNGSAVLQGFMLVFQLMRYGIVIPDGEATRMKNHLKFTGILYDVVPEEQMLNFNIFLLASFKLIRRFKKVAEIELEQKFLVPSQTMDNQDIFKMVLDSLKAYTRAVDCLGNFIDIHLPLDIDVNSFIVTLLRPLYHGVCICYDQAQIRVEWCERAFFAMDYDSSNNFLKTYNESITTIYSKIENFRMWCSRHIELRDLVEKPIFSINYSEELFKLHIQSFNTTITDQQYVASKNISFTMLANIKKEGNKPWEGTNKFLESSSK